MSPVDEALLINRDKRSVKLAAPPGVVAAPGVVIQPAYGLAEPPGLFMPPMPPARLAPLESAPARVVPRVVPRELPMLPPPPPLLPPAPRLFNASAISLAFAYLIGMTSETNSDGTFASI